MTDAEDVVGGHTRSELARIAREEIPGDANPGFAAVSGSHRYGWADESSDVDLRGFHVADGRRYALLDTPAEQVTATFGSPGRDVADVDFVSYELRKFGMLVADRNFNALETLFDGGVVLEEKPRRLDDLRGLVADRLPMDVPARYAGMARSNRDAAAPGGSVKRCLYAVRGLLAANYVAEHGEIEADVRVLSEAVIGDTGLVDDLIVAKQSESDARLDRGLANRANAVLDDLERSEWPARDEPGSFRRAVDEWMRVTRDWA